MNNSVVLGAIAADDVIYRVKRVAYPGEMLLPGGGHNHVYFGDEGGDPMYFANVYNDNWYPQTGLANQTEFFVPIGGTYQLHLHVRFPDVGVEGVGWLHGWSGSGGGDVWLQTRRGGGVLEDNIGRQSQGWPGGSNPTYDLGPIYRVLQKGDSIRGMAQGGATGLGPVAWDATLTMYWLVGGGGPPGPT